MKAIIITNNRAISSLTDIAEYDVELLENAEFLAVLKRVRDAVHRGHKLLTHPLSGSIKPYETPYKSVALSADRASLDMMSLQTIENAIATAEKFKRQQPGNRHLTEDVLADFRLIDLQLIENALNK